MTKWEGTQEIQFRDVDIENSVIYNSPAPGYDIKEKVEIKEKKGIEYCMYYRATKI